MNKNVENFLFHQKILENLRISILLQVDMFQKVLSNNLLAKIDFIAFSVRFGDTILRNDGLKMFPTLGDLLLWQR